MSISKSNEPYLKIYCMRFKGEKGCDPKKCSALRLREFSLLKIINKIRNPLNKAVVLNPFSQKEISIEDRDTILKYGLIVIDCSWKKLVNFKDFDLENGRKLPPLIAANPVNYGKWEKLSSAEALASALYITKYESYARLILSKFSWGKEFLKLNFRKK